MGFGVRGVFILNTAKVCVSVKRQKLKIDANRFCLPAKRFASILAFGVLLLQKRRLCQWTVYL